MTVESNDAPPTETSWGLRGLATMFLLIAFLMVVGIAGFKYQMFKKEGERRAGEVAEGPEVHVETLKKGMGEHSVTLIGETRPYQSATLFAKVSGYLKKNSVDKGDVVEEGQFLAYIESPETDEAYLGAEADAKNKKAILDRMAILFKKQLVSQQEFDQAQADSDVAEARLRAQRTLKGYETIRAPFRGTITARYADPGALVQSAVSSDTSALPVLMISEVRRLRLDVFIDQRDAPYVQKGDPVTITLPERPGYKLNGLVARVTNELDPRTKMLLTEIDIQNEDRSLVAGSFVQVSLLVKSPPYLEAPVEALALKNDKTYLTVVTNDNTLTYREIAVGSNDGRMITILNGAQEGEHVALSVGNSLPEGSKIRPVSDKPKAPQTSITPVSATAPTPSPAPSPGPSPSSIAGASQ